jgi:para-aminobenzoate synthetase/4-amino-4-deoxychorismate lyase
MLRAAMTVQIRFAACEPPLQCRFTSPPREVLVALRPDEVRDVLDAAHAHALAGRWCAGFVRYEAAPAFDAAFEVHAADGPLAWFAVYDAPDAGPAPAPVEATGQVAWHEDGVSRVGFDAAIAQIHRAIADGEVYQVNHTARRRGVFSGHAQALFEALHRSQPDGYAAFIDTGGEQLLSVSPELFFDWRADGTILTRPMKGTAPRGATPEADRRAAAALRAAPKERAENVMIVDLLRNDLSRVALPHSVQVPRLFHLEALPTVWQMTSDVTARTRPGTTLADVFGALFPCGSVTGAPKVQAMRRIRRLEPDARGVYCGAVGVLRPGGAATFNVAIRTVTLRGAQAACGIGSGITADATAEGEWAEWRHKRAFLERASAPFELLQTLRLEEGALAAADMHLDRMAQAAAHFGFAWNAAAARDALAAVVQAHPHGLWRVRLLAGATGACRAEAHAMAETPAPVRVRLAAWPFEEAQSEFVRFKTTRRAHYERFAPEEPAVFDTLLWNERGEITEFTRGSVALKLDGRWVTPPLACGLLDGVGRARALREGRVVEAVVRVEDMPRVEALAFVNGLRGWLDGVLD